MANQNIFVSQRSGDWSVTSDKANSPWYAPSTAALAGTPSTATPSGDSGWTVQIDHAITMDVNATVGGSFPQAGWEPVPFSHTSGGVATQLVDGTYRAAFQVVATNGTSSAGNTESALITLHSGVSKPRVDFGLPPPSGCTYSLYLTDASGQSGWERIYCSGITDAICDLFVGTWDNDFSNGVSAAGASSKPYATARALTPVQNCSAITIGPKGSLTIARSKVLTLKGDLWVSSPAGGTSDYLTLGWGGQVKFDSSIAIPVGQVEYVIWFAGGGRIRLLGDTS